MTYDPRPRAFSAIVPGGRITPCIVMIYPQGVSELSIASGFHVGGDIDASTQLP